jgi:phage baseplate assembly protein W
MAALRFVHPDFDRDGAPGLTLSKGGHLALVEGEQAVRQSILMLLSTMPGERLRRPGYGCNLHLLAFAPNDETTQGLAMHYVRLAIATWEPRVEVVSVDARRDDAAGEIMRIDLRYVIRRTGVEVAQALMFDLGQGAAT